MKSTLRELCLEFRLPPDPIPAISCCKVVGFFSPSLSLLSKGDLENRAQLREPASMLIFNAIRTDTAEYRCEVAYNDGSGEFDEIKINLEVRGVYNQPTK